MALTGAADLGIIHRLILTVLPSVAVVVFFIGLYIRYRTWERGFPQYRLPMMPTAKDLAFTTKHLARKDVVSTWLLLWPLHVTFMVIFFGHLRSIGLWSVDWFLWLAPKQFLTKALPTALGFVFLASVAILFLKRLTSIGFSLPSSRFGDLTFISFVLAIVLTGMIMRVLPHDPGVLSVYIVPFIKMNVDKIPNLDALAIHTFVAELFVMYIPFSRLMHLITGIVT
jgi:nitrate reductase gamma subunit